MNKVLRIRRFIEKGIGHINNAKFNPLPPPGTLMPNTVCDPNRCLGGGGWVGFSSRTTHSSFNKWGSAQGPTDSPFNKWGSAQGATDSSSKFSVVDTGLV